MPQIKHFASLMQAFYGVRECSEDGALRGMSGRVKKRQKEKEMKALSFEHLSFHLAGGFSFFAP